MSHNFKGYKAGDTITVEGSYDINIWYSCQDDTKTEVVRQTDTYKETVVVPRKNNSNISGDEEIIVRSLRQPSCVKAEIQNGMIVYTIEKELGIEIVGDTKVKIAIDEDEDEWDIIDDDVIDNEIDKKIDEEVNEEFLD
ncbi:MAG: outer spore coat protein CotE [Bacilli bacterium]|nr:outer spore coat protein CotE [Bacilli bacterium]